MRTALFLIWLALPNAGARVDPSTGTGLGAARPHPEPLSALGNSVSVPQDAAWEPSTYLGAAIGSAGDANGDGFPEIYIGSYSERKVWVFSAKKGKLLYSVKEKKGDFGWSVASAGDTDQDGTSDLIVGSPETDTVHLYKGRKGKSLTTIEGEPGTRFGWAVSGVGDTNGNGFSEVVIASRGDGASRPGSARLYAAKSGDMLHDLTDGLPAPCDVFAVSGAGDTNADGFNDVLVGTPFEGDGVVRIYSGKDGQLLQTLSGVSANEGFGMAVAGAGDIDADGFDDIIVGAPFGAGGAGRAAVFSGKDGQTFFEASGSKIGERFGQSVSSGGDMNLDGRYDIVIGAPGAPRDLTSGPFAELLQGLPDDATNRTATRGRAVVLSGRGGTVLHEITSADENDWFGVSIAGIGDANGDGRPDFVVGLDLHDAKKDERSAEARVFSGKGAEQLHAFADGKRLKDKK